MRYSTGHHSRTLFVSEDANALRKLHPDNPRLQRLSETDHVIVSEPLGDLPGAWLEVPSRPPSRSRRGRESSGRSGRSPRR